MKRRGPSAKPKSPHADSFHLEKKPTKPVVSRPRGHSTQNVTGRVGVEVRQFILCVPSDLSLPAGRSTARGLFASTWSLQGLLRAHRYTHNHMHLARYCRSLGSSRARIFFRRSSGILAFFFFSCFSSIFFLLRVSGSMPSQQGSIKGHRRCGPQSRDENGEFRRRLSD
ncbi:LAQU0S01e03356g1_1 [Lachancea quebecensis]|uniref:LAQU0S01e03356g1_1 n=1 Tax=Lachancea quebecensis TaxID=1654605 RepID=A0A0P1KKZ5_9SACH|nr:LAQU0S01e03356g1_1 [Lachancea quebecensis]